MNCWASLKAEAKAKLKQQYWIGQLKAAGYTVEYHMQPGTEPFYKWVHADGDSQDESSVSEEDSWNAAWQHMESKCPK